MTVIVAARMENGVVVMAADRQVTAGWQKGVHDQPKLWTSSDWIVGGAGAMRSLQVLKHHLAYPRYRPDEDTDWEAFAVKTLVPAIRAAVKDQGVTQVKDGVEHFSSSALFAIKDQIVEIGSDGSAYSDITGRIAIGSGYAEALGFLGDSGPWQEADVIEAVTRATQTAVGVSGPIDVVDTETLTVRPAKASPRVVPTRPDPGVPEKPARKKVKA